MSKKYKRYMVFCSSEFDNVEPFDCIPLSTDSKSEALEYSEGDYLTVVFDRIEGQIIRSEVNDW